MAMLISSSNQRAVLPSDTSASEHKKLKPASEDKILPKPRCAIANTILPAALADKTTLAKTMLSHVSGQTGMPTLYEVRSCFSEIRAYYKSGLKSFNKFYYPLLDKSDRDEGGEVRSYRVLTSQGSLKARRRNENTALSLESRRNFGSFDEGKTLAEQGGQLFANNSKGGACGEMALIASYYINQRFPDAQLHVLAVGDEIVGNHSLVVCGTPPPFKSARDWKSHEFEGSSYAIDVWMNICCPTHEYAEQVVRKIDKWTLEGKGVLVATSSDTDNPVVMPDGDSYSFFIPNIPNSKIYSGMLLNSVPEIFCAT